MAEFMASVMSLINLGPSCFHRASSVVVSHQVLIARLGDKPSGLALAKAQPIVLYALVDTPSICVSTVICSESAVAFSALPAEDFICCGDQ